MSKIFRTGNVIKTVHGHIEIVTNVTDDLTQTVSFAFENCSSIHKNISIMGNEQCFCCENNNNVYDDECTDCKGTGSYKKLRPGMDTAKLLAPNVKDYILKRLLKNFDF